MLNTWLAVLSPFLAGLLGLVMFTTLLTAIIFVFMLCLLGYYYTLFAKKHHHHEWDDKLSEKRQAQAIQEYLALMEVKRKRGSLE